MRTFVGVTAAVVTLATSSVAATAATPRAFDGGTLKRKPATIIYTGDGSALLAGRSKAGGHPFGHLHWTSWGYRSARAWGDDWHNNCVPYCAAGTFTGYHANLKLYRPETFGGRRVFSRMSVTYPSTRPPYTFYQRHRTWIARLVWERQYNVFYWKTW